MLNSRQMDVALRAVSMIDYEALYVVTSKLIKDIDNGTFDETYEITSNIKVRDLQRRGAWRQDMHILAVITASAAGNIMREAIKAAGIDPMRGTWQQMIQFAAATTHIENVVVRKLLEDWIAGPPCPQPVLH